MRISDWSSDVCSSDLIRPPVGRDRKAKLEQAGAASPPHGHAPERYPRFRQNVPTRGNGLNQSYWIPPELYPRESACLHAAWQLFFTSYEIVNYFFTNSVTSCTQSKPKHGSARNGKDDRTPLQKHSLKEPET